MAINWDFCESIRYISLVRIPPYLPLASDISILENKIRLKKPLLVPFDGPYNRTNAWLKQFYSTKSLAVGETQGAYQNDW